MPALALSLAIKNRNRKALERELQKRQKRQPVSVKQGPSESNQVKQTKLKV
jgi:hypothetical protein